MSPLPVFQDKTNSSTILLVMRHGIAEPREIAATDEEDARRALTAKGRRRVQDMATLLKTLGLIPTTYLSSPRIRAFQTADIICDTFSPKKSILRTDSLDFHGNWSAVVSEVARAAPSGGIVLAAGHEPCCSEYVTQAVLPDHIIFSVKKAGVIGLSWKGSIQESGASFLFYITPKMARRSLNE